MHKTRLVLFSLTLLIGFLFAAKAVINFKNSNSPQPTTVIQPAAPSPAPTETIPAPVFSSIKAGKNELNIEIASTPDEIQLGLSGRKEIGSDGMLFVIDPPRQISFWMKDMFFPIDIIWISNSKISGIEKNVPMPPADITDDKLHLYNSPSPVDYVLELKAGDAEFWSIKVGDNISIPPTNN